MDHIVGLGECIISNNTHDKIITFALSTCIGLTAYFPEKKILAMVHIVLPDSTAFESEKDFKIMKFANTAVPDLFNSLGFKYGCTSREKKNIKIFGGASSLEKDYFKIGERNLNAVRRELDKLSFFYDDNETGGSVSRTLVASVSSGAIEVIKRPL